MALSIQIKGLTISILRSIHIEDKVLTKVINIKILKWSKWNNTRLTTQNRIKFEVKIKDLYF